MESATIGILSESILFNGLHQEDIKKIYLHGQLDSFKEGEVIIREGQEELSLYLLIEGSSAVMLPKDGPGFERINNVDLSRKIKGDCFGEYSFLDGKPVSASVVALEPCKVFSISRDNLMEFLEADDSLAKIIYLNFSRMFVSKMRQLVKDSETFILV